MKIEVKSGDVRFQTYFADKEARDQILEVIIDNSLSRKTVENFVRDLKID